MKSFPTPIVVVSKCLGFGVCRYDGERIDNPFLRHLRQHVRFLTVCPEVEIGLGVPRDPIDIVLAGGYKMLCQLATGRNLTRRMAGFSRRFLDSLDKVDGFVLKRNSPSCGICGAKILASADVNAKVIRQDTGFFAAHVLERFGALAVEDDRRLEDSRIRHHWLTKLFTLAAFHTARRLVSMKKLAKFHAQNRLLLTAYNQKQTRALDRIICNQGKRPADEVAAEYETHLWLALRRPARLASNIRILTLALDHFSRHLSRSEKASFLRSLKRYREHGTPLSAILKTVGVWAVRYDKTYVKDQTFFRPYPGEFL